MGVGGPFDLLFMGFAVDARAPAVEPEHRGPPERQQQPQPLNRPAPAHRPLKLQLLPSV